MRILGINCSQRSNSNSERLLAYVLDAVESARKDAQITRLNLRELTIDCLGCDACLLKADHHQDDLAKRYAELLAADLVIMATPTCYGMPPAAAKAFMDRTDAFWFDKLLKGKKGAVIVNGASPGERIDECKQAVQWYFEAHGMEKLKNNPCFQDSEHYPDQRFPDPLPKELSKKLDALAAEIGSLR
jgi:multimeric flavodoxin WrbA